MDGCTQQMSWTPCKSCVPAARGVLFPLPCRAQHLDNTATSGNAVPSISLCNACQPQSTPRTMDSTTLSQTRRSFFGAGDKHHIKNQPPCGRSPTHGQARNTCKGCTAFENLHSLRQAINPVAALHSRIITVATLCSHCQQRAKLAMHKMPS